MSDILKAIGVLAIITLCLLGWAGIRGGMHPPADCDIDCQDAAEGYS